MEENKKEERKRCNINIRLTEEDFNRIKTKADNMNMSISDYVRYCLLKEDLEKIKFKPSTIKEYRKKYENVLIKNTGNSDMIVEFFNILEELVSIISIFKKSV